MARASAVLFSVLVLAVGGFLTVLSLVDLAPYLARAEGSLGAGLGGKVVLQGPARFSLWPEPRLTLEGFTVQAPQGEAASAAVFSAREVTAALSLQSLFPPRLGFRELRVAAAQLTALPASRDAAQALAVSALSAPRQPVTLEGLPVQLVLPPTDLMVLDLTLAETAAPVGGLHLERATVHRGASGVVSVSAFATYRGEPLFFRGEGTAADQEAPGVPAAWVRAEITGDATHLAASGRVSLGKRLGFNGRWAGEVEDWRMLGAVFDTRLRPAAPMEFDLAVDGTEEGATLKGAFSRFGRGDLNADLIVTARDGIALIGSLTAKKLDLAGFALTEEGGTTGRLIPDIGIDALPLRAARIDLNLKAEETTAGGEIWGPLRASLWADRGVWALGPVELDLIEGMASGDLTLDARADPRATLTLKISTESPGLLKLAGVASEGADGRLDLAVELFGAGHSLGEMAATASGQTNLLIGARGALALPTAWLPGSLTDGLAATAPAGVQPAVAHSGRSACVVSRFDIRDGIAESRVLLVDNGPVLAAGSGTIDLAAERVDFELRPRPRDPHLVSAAKDLLISGPIKQPKVTASADGRRKGIARSTGLASLTEGYRTLMPLLPPVAIMANPCITDTMGETALAQLRNTVALGHVEGPELDSEAASDAKPLAQ